MSRLTASPFHKPSAHETMVRPPLSPPDTLRQDSYMTAPTVARGIEHLFDSESPSVARGIEGLPEQETPSASPAARFRKVSTLAYLNSGLREPRERASPRPASRSFIVVIPPPNFQHEHGALGHTLSSGPAHRQSQGILMPLLPTFYAQVTAIAREWNFPSTSGLCLYLQYTDNGITVCPRVGDDTWQLMWSQALDPTSPSAARPPIVGKVEFDIDMRLARWYGSWLASAHRDAPYDVPSSIGPSLPPSEAHYRHDSRTTHHEEELQDDRSVITRPSARPRHIPRKLSLVDRYDSASLRSRGTSRLAVTPPENTAVPAAQALSPIQQLEEPKSSLANKVMSWRASSGNQATTLLAASGQISLEPANMPNSVDIQSPELPVEDEELNLADFTWSISSAGPLSHNDGFDYDYEESCLPSVHLDRRLEGSVCLTPSVCTSFGPSDYTLSDVESVYRLPSPDLAQRMLEDCPPSPSTATSWGAPLSWPASPASSVSRPPSVDLGERAVFSRPVTPGTATTWGPPSSWPASPASSYHPRSVHLGDRIEFSRPATPSTATSWGAPLSYPPTPASPRFVRTPDAGQRAFDPEETAPRRTVMSFPYYNPAQGQTWQHVWPYNALRTAVEVSEEEPRGQGEPWGHVWPYGATAVENVQPWSHSWPYNARRDEEASQSEEDTAPRASAMSFPYYNPAQGQTWAHVWPYTSLKTTADVSMDVENVQPPRLGSGYPFFELYPAQYPHNLSRIYPSLQQNNFRTVEVVIHRGYPYMQIYAPQYPHNLDQIYPVIQRAPTCGIEVKVHRPYPHLEIYAPQYPHNLSRIYPQSVKRVARQENARGIPVVIAQGYPRFILYPSPAKQDAMQKKLAVIPIVIPRGYPNFLLYGAAKSGNGPAPINVRFTGYPYFELYGKPYPSNLNALYPAVAPKAKPQQNVQAYPFFVLYPAVFPHNLREIYPAVKPVMATSTGSGFRFGWPYFKTGCGEAKRSGAVSAAKTSILVNVRCTGYPHFELYARPYPHNLRSLYPTSKRPERTPSMAQYPFFLLYPAVFPHNLREVYPTIKPVMFLAPPSKERDFRFGWPYFRVDGRTVQSPREGTSRAKAAPVPVNIRPRAGYPNFVLYAPVYPLNLSSLYPGVIRSEPANAGLIVRIKAVYPDFDLYPAVYPFNLREIYPTVIKAAVDPSVIRSRYPFFVLYPVVYPSFDLYPIVKPRMSALVKSKPRRTHAQLHATVLKAKGFLSLARRPLKSHRDLHREVFPASSARDLDVKASLLSPPQSATSPSSPRSPSGRRLSYIRAPRGPRMAPPEVPLPRTPLAELPEKVLTSPPAMPRRAMSARTVPHSEGPPPAGLARRPTTDSVRPGHRKRDSIVLQRVRAMEHGGETPSPGPPPRQPPPVRPVT